MSCTDTGESVSILTDVIGVVVRGANNKNNTKKAAAPLWQATLENSRAQFRAWSNSAASTRVVATPSASQNAAASSRASSAGASRHEPGHDLAAHGDLERHCGTPWFS